MAEPVFYGAIVWRSVFAVLMDLRRCAGRFLLRDAMPKMAGALFRFHGVAGGGFAERRIGSAAIF